MANVRIQRTSVRTLGQGDANVRLQRTAAKVLTQPGSSARLQRTVVKSMAQGDASLRLQRTSIKVLAQSDSDARMQRFSTVIMAAGVSDARMQRFSTVIMAAGVSDARMQRFGITVMAVPTPDPTVRYADQVVSLSPLSTYRIAEQAVSLLAVASIRYADQTVSEFAPSRLHAASIGVTTQGTSDARVHSAVLQTLTQGTAPARIHNSSLMVLTQGTEPARVHVSNLMVLTKEIQIQLQAGIWKEALPIGLRINYQGYIDKISSYNPLSWWRLDETSGTTASDSGTTLNNGTYIGSPTLEQPGLLVGDSSVLFDGSDDNVSSSWSSQYDWSTASSRTYAVWYKGTDVGTNAGGGTVGPKAFIAASTSGTHKKFVLGLDADGKVRGYTDGNYVMVGPTTSSVNDDMYHFIALTIEYNGSTYTTKLFIDGQQEANSTSSNNTGNGSPSVTIGRNPRAGATGYIVGNIAEVFILPNAINTQQASDIYEAGALGLS